MGMWKARSSEVVTIKNYGFQASHVSNGLRSISGKPGERLSESYGDSDHGCFLRQPTEELSSYCMGQHHASVSCSCKKSALIHISCLFPFPKVRFLPLELEACMPHFLLCI